VPTLIYHHTGKETIMRLKRPASIATVIVLLIILITMVITPLVAMAQPGAQGQGRGFAGPGNPCGGRFRVLLFDSIGCYEWVEKWQQGKTLAEPVDQVGTCYVSMGQGVEYKIEIPEGTVVEGYYPTLKRAHHLQIKVAGGKLYFYPSLKFSQPATLYQQVDGEWVKVLSFTEVLNGQAS
jgi:hypothetical protein